MHASLDLWLALSRGDHSALEVVAFAYARIGPVCLMLPFFGERLFANVMMRHALIALLAVALWPAIMPVADKALSSTGDLVWILVKECATGTAIGLTLAMPFWICSAVGAWIDNQRGATISEVLDPLHGVEVSTFSAFLSVYAGAAFLANDGMRTLVDVLASSYIESQRPDGLKIDWLRYVTFFDTLSREALRLSAPVISAMFATELLLGMLSRFATQMGVFALAFSLKSLIAFVVFYLYFGPSLAELFTTFAHVVPGRIFGP